MEIVIYKKENNGKVWYVTYIRYKYFFKLLRNEFPIVKDEDGSFRSKEVVETFPSIQATISETEEEALNLGREFVKYWRDEYSRKYPVITTTEVKTFTI